MLSPEIRQQMAIERIMRRLEQKLDALMAPAQDRIVELEAEATAYKAMWDAEVANRVRLCSLCGHAEEHHSFNFCEHHYCDCPGWEAMIP